MTDDDDDYRALTERFEALNDEVRETSGVLAAFNQSLSEYRAQMVYTDKEVASLSRSFGKTMRGAFDDVVLDGKKFSDLLRDIGQSMANAAYNTAMQPIQNAVGGVVAGGLNSVLSTIMPFEKGGNFVQGKVTPFASVCLNTQAPIRPSR